MLFKEYTFEEWNKLSFENKRVIWNHYGNPWEVEKGIKTRQNILQSFKTFYPDISKQAIEIGYGYFGWEEGMIYVIIDKPSQRIPKNFADISINKGILISRINSKEIIFSWRDSGGSNAKFKLNSTKYHMLLKNTAYQSVKTDSQKHLLLNRHIR